MEPTFWIDRWREGRIGFHEGTPNTFLARHAERLAGRRVLVPLCGKSEDLAYLAAHGHEVIGIELVEDAVRAFFAEHALTPQVTQRGALVRYAAAAITILAGDLFAAEREDVGTIEAIYDRAALIALPPVVRRRYVDHLRTLTAAGTRGLLVTLEYPQHEHAGPPFSVAEAEVRALYATAELLDEHAEASDRFSSADERCYAVTL